MDILLWVFYLYLYITVHFTTFKFATNAYKSIIYVLQREKETLNLSFYRVLYFQY